ncbi:MAG TPA: beta/gamma crystallin-related protein [Thermoanaerobaculia bacterium]|nr:beta/gamma crystallin-related protein [Thermoanaerobaculia bacterium]
MRARNLILLAGAALLFLAAALPAQQRRPVRTADDQPLRSLEVTVEDLSTGQILGSLDRGETIVIRPGQQIRLRMTGSLGPNSPTRYPNTTFDPNNLDSRYVRVDKVNPEVGSIIVTGVAPNPGPGALRIHYVIGDEMPIGDPREKEGNVYVRVEEAQVTPPSQPPQPAASGGITLYSDDSFRGRSQTFLEDDPDLRDNPIQSDSVSSLRVAPGCRAILFEDTFYRGASAVIDRDSPNLRGTGVANDSVSSLRVECGSGTARRGITVFEDAGFRGSSQALVAGDYSELRGGVGNDRISSIRVDAGCRAVLFSDSGFGGRSWTIDRDVGNLDGSPVGNDSISSIQVICG